MKYQLFTIAFVMKLFLIHGMEPIQLPTRVRVGTKVLIKMVQFGNCLPCLRVDHPDKSILGFEGTHIVDTYDNQENPEYKHALRNTLVYLYTGVRPGVGTLTFWSGTAAQEYKQTRTIIVEPLVEDEIFYKDK